MSQTQTDQAHATALLDTKLEVVVIPVADVDRSKRFYQNLGWRLDADFVFSEAFRVVQMTPPGSPCSVIFGKGVTPAAPGSAAGVFLVVDDAAAARAELVKLGADVTEVFHFDRGLHLMGTQGRVPGKDPEARSYSTFASFRDPDGNTFLIQEITSRLPGRGFGSDIATLTDLLRDAEQRHGAYEASAPKHHWSDWYAAYITARERGKTPEQSVQAAALHMKQKL